MIEKIIERLSAKEKLHKNMTNDKTGVLSAMDKCSHLHYAECFKEAKEIVQEVAKDGGWIPTERELPPHSDNLLLVQCSGKTGNVVLEDAFCLASYTEEGWILEMYPELENLDVAAWQHLPIPYQKRHCFTCNDLLSGVCVNGDSEHRADFRCADDACEHWKQKGE